MLYLWVKVLKISDRAWVNKKDTQTNTEWQQNIWIIFTKFMSRKEENYKNTRKIK